MELGQGDGAAGKVGRPTERGYAPAVLLVGLSVMAVFMTMAMPVWTQFNKREKEAELIWRGQQYMRAISQFQRKYANTFPPSVDLLVEQKFLRKKYKDPITDDDFQPIPAGGIVNPGQLPGIGAGGGRPPSGTPPVQGRPGAPGTATPSTPTLSGVPGGTSAGAIGIQGVVSKSKDTSIKIYNGRTHYNEWAFIALVTNQRAGTGAVPGAAGQRPGGRPPVPGETGGTTFTRPGQSGPGAQPSPFGVPPGGPRPPGQPPPQRPPGR
jgi:type II secretory pathway pseudopilin PulG